MKMSNYTSLIAILVVTFAISLPVSGADAKESNGSRSFIPGADAAKIADSASPAESVKPATDTPPADKKAVEKVAEPEGKKGSPAGKDAKAPQGLDPFLPMILIMGVLFLMMMLSGRNRKKQEKKHNEMLDSLKKGDRIVTRGGICGSVVEVKEKEVVAKVSDNSRIRFAKWAIMASGDDAPESEPTQ